ncbi:semaphorin-3D-like isoform X1 [Pezoporus wallicus]|uniref:semaphorin-3D-like isoform X1 n=2 Tax=Pezoporus wallicus TaxID=35540 RepID=UPI00254DA203|nr:semaphorin-3D-like isoform X1 [Pezoporus wallicus]
MNEGLPRCPQLLPAAQPPGTRGRAGSWARSPPLRSRGLLGCWQRGWHLSAGPWCCEDEVSVPFPLLSARMHPAPHRSLPLAALLLCLLLQQLGSSKAWKQHAPRLRLAYKDLLKSNSSRLLLASGDGMDFQALLVDEDMAWLMVGAKNHIFLLHLDHPSREPEKIFWPASREQVEHCQLAGKNVETECANFIRLLQPFNRTHVFACGTGSYQPVCAFIQLGARGKAAGAPIMRLVTHSLESGRGRCPYSPHEPFTGLLVDGELYSGTSSDFMGSSAAFFRTWVHGAEQSYIRTEQNQDHWLHEPAFVGAYAIPDTYNPHDDKVYIFFRETAMEAGQWERRHIQARVARVCKNDVGGKHSLINRWSTFLKARLVCSIPGPHGTETHFDQLEDVFLLRTRDPQNPLVFGLFTVSSGVFSGSAVCVYSMAAVRAAFSGPFAHKEGFDYRWVEYKGRVPYPRPGTCPSETYDPLLQSTKDFPDEVISFMRTHQLMWEPVYPQGRQPVLARVNVPYRLRRLLVHRLEVENRHYDVLFLGTDEGKVLKVGLAGGMSRGTEVISLEEISVTKVPSPILDMKLSLKRQELFVSSTHGLIQLSLYRCELYGKTCTDCCLARDPYCTWDSRTCSPHVLTEKRRARCQDVLKSDPLSQCQDTAEGTAAVEKLVFGVEKNSTFLECLARSPQTTVRWLVRHGEDADLSEVGSHGRFSVLEQGLLIRQLAPEDAGTYECRAVERSFSRPLTRYSLRVIRHEAMELSPYKRSKGAELGGTHQSPRPRTDLHPGYKGFPRALGAPGTSLDVYCNALRLQERQRQKAWHQKWQHPSPDSKGGRVRRHRQPL